VIAKTFLSAFFLLLLLGACTESGVDHETEGAALMQQSRDWSALAASGDMESVMEFWADDALMLPPDGPLLDGKQAIREYVEGAANIPGFGISWEPERVQLSQSGDMAYLIEKNVTEFDDAEGNKVTVYGKVVTIWRKDSDGNWKNVVDMWNTVSPPD